MLGDVGDFAGHRPRAVVGRDPRASGEFLVGRGHRRPGQRRRRRPGRRRPADAGGRLPDGRLRRRPRRRCSRPRTTRCRTTGSSSSPAAASSSTTSSRHAIEARMRRGLAAPDRRRRRTGHAVRRAPPTRYVAHLLVRRTAPAGRAARSSSTAPTAPRAWSRPRRPARGRRRGRRDPRRAGRPQHQRGVRLDPPRGPAARPSSRTAPTSGIAHDGDADRCLAVDADGPGRRRRPDHGGRSRSRCATAAGSTDDTLVATVMSNLGLLLAMEAEPGSPMRQTAVGDRYVLEAMRAGGFNLGGEQSGHVVMADHATTGDGVLSGAACCCPGWPRPAARWPSWPRWSSGCRRCWSTSPASTRPGPATTSRSPPPSPSAQTELGGQGRVLLRPSGTEALVRVMVEASDVAQAQAVADRLATGRARAPLAVSRVRRAMRRRGPIGRAIAMACWCFRPGRSRRHRASVLGRHPGPAAASTSCAISGLPPQDETDGARRSDAGPFPYRAGRRDLRQPRASPAQGAAGLLPRVHRDHTRIRGSRHPPSHRGRRLATAPSTLYYTGDHYASFCVLTGAP